MKFNILAFFDACLPDDAAIKWYSESISASAFFLFARKWFRARKSKNENWNSRLSQWSDVQRPHATESSIKADRSWQAENLLNERENKRHSEARTHGQTRDRSGWFMKTNSGGFEWEFCFRWAVAAATECESWMMNGKCKWINQARHRAGGSLSDVH